MKSTRMIGNGYNMSSVILQVKSRISSIKSALTIGLMLMVGGGNVWGGEQTFYAKIRVLSEPSIGGYVYIAQDAQAASAAEDNGKTDDSSSPSYKNTWVTMFGANIGKESSHTFDLYGYQSAKTGFAFKGWSTSQTANSGSTNTESSWGRKYYPFSITSSSTNMNSPATATYYAIFAGVVSTSNTTSGSLSFGDVDMGSSKELTFVFKHAHAGKISGSFSGDGDFKLKAGTSLPASSTTLANCTITVVFTPSCGDTRSGTLTLTGANGGSMSISLTGNGVRHTPSISTTDGSVNVTVGSPATTINLNDRVTCDNTDGDKTYTKANNSDPVTISGSSFSATKAGTYTVNVKVAQTCYYYETTSSFKITVNRLPSSIAMNNGSVNVSVAGINSSTLDLSTLIKTGKTGNGAITYTIKSASGKNATTSTASIASDKKTFSATECGTYTLTATQAQTDQYESSTSNEFTITVNKLTPTIVFDNTENPEVVYSNDEINQPAYRSYNGKVVDRNVNYSSDEVAIYPDGTKLYVRDVTAPEGTSIAVTITATSAADDYYNAASSSVTHNYAVRAKRSPIFYLDNNADNTAKTFEIGQTAVISYNENTDAGLTVGTEGEKSFISYVHDPQARTITVTAVKGSLSGNGVQTITLNQPGTTRFFPRNKVYTFTVTKHQSTITLTSTGSMYVEDTITTPYSGLANDDAVTFSCSPEGSMKMENGKLIALQAGSNKVTFTQAATEYWTGISQTKTIQVNKITPTITTNLSTRHPWYSIIEHPFVSENTMTDFMVQSGNDDLAKYFAGDDEILVYGTSANSVTFTFNQPGNYKYEEVKNHRVSFEIFQTKALIFSADENGKACNR